MIVGIATGNYRRTVGLTAIGATLGTARGTVAVVPVIITRDIVVIIHVLLSLERRTIQKGNRAIDGMVPQNDIKVAAKNNLSIIPSPIMLKVTMPEEH